MNVSSILTDVKVAITVAATTASTGLGAALDLIPEDVGKLAALVGICLSLVLIYTHLRNGRQQYRKTEIEIELLRRQRGD